LNGISPAKLSRVTAEPEEISDCEGNVPQDLCHDGEIQGKTDFPSVSFYSTLV